MSIQFTVNVDIDKNLISKRAESADESLANEVLKDTDKFVPKLTGKLSQMAHTEGNKVIYPGPYAHYQYEGIVYVDPKTGAAGFQTKNGWRSKKGVSKVPSGRTLNHKNGRSKWFEASKAANKSKWLQYYKKEITSGK